MNNLKALKTVLETIHHVVSHDPWHGRCVLLKNSDTQIIVDCACPDSTLTAGNDAVQRLTSQLGPAMQQQLRECGVDIDTIAVETTQSEPTREHHIYLRATLTENIPDRITRLTRGRY
jgi:hypothetical protein